MKNKKLRPSEEAVVGIVVAVLLIGLTVSVVALVQTQYVPKWMKQKESEHMEEVIDQFTRMKFAIDTQIATTIETPIATTISLGSKELPYLLSQRSFGQLDIIPGSDSGCRFQITTLEDNTNYTIYDTNDIDNDSDPGIGIIQYSSSNAYYLDQTFIYESGSIITSQSDGYDMTIRPSFSIKQAAGNYILTIELVDVNSVGGKIQGSGYGSTAIMTEYSKPLINDTLDDNVNVSKIVITSNYPDEWYNYMNWSLSSNLASTDYEIYRPVGNDITITFFVYILLDLKVHEIKAQLGPGWVE